MEWLLVAVYLNLYPPTGWAEQYPTEVWIPEVARVEVIDTLPTEDNCNEFRDLILGSVKEVPKNLNFGCISSYVNLEALHNKNWRI